VLSGARAALAFHGGAHHPEDGEHGVEVVRIRAHHDGQGGVPGADVAAGHGRIHGPDAAPLRRFMDADGQFRRRGGRVDQERAGRGPLNEAVPAEIKLFHVLGKSHHRDDDIAFGGDVRRSGKPGAQTDERLGFGARPVENRQRVSRAKQVAGHRGAHDAGADEADARFRLLHDGSRPSSQIQNS